jgi:multidrug efflux system membrane fusion protein
MDALTPDPVETRPPPGRGWRRRLGRAAPWLLSAAILGAIAYTVWFWPAPAPEAQPNRRNPNFAIPVLVAAAEKRDAPVWLDGLGTVQAFQTVTVKSMVDGPLLAVRFAEGQTVRKGDVLAEIDPRTFKAALDTATAKKAQNEALLANAKLDLDRYRKLAASNFASAQQADTAAAQVAQLTAQIEQDKAAIDNARTQLGYATIVSPLDGRAGIRLVDAGNIVRAGDQTGLVTIAQLQPISVVFTLPQQLLGAVAKAMAQGAPPVVATAQGAPAAGGQVLDRGVLAALDNQVDPATGTIKLKATFPNADGSLWPGGFVGVRVRAAVIADAVVVPTSAIQRGPRGAYVYLVKDDQTAARLAVGVGYEDERGSVVTDGLKGGEKVVIDGASRLVEGSKVAPAEAGSEGGPARPQGAPGARRARGG